MIRKIFAIGVFVALWSHLWTAQVDAYQLKLHGNRLTLQAQSVPMQTILKTLSAQGIVVRIDPQINPPVTANFSDLNLQTALASILKPVNYVLVWNEIEGPGGSIEVLAEILIFKKGRRDKMRDLPGRRALNLVRNPGDGAWYVKDEIMLRVSPRVSRDAFIKLVQSFGGRVIGKVAGLDIYRVRLPNDTNIPDLVEKISQAPGIAAAEPNYAYPITAPHRAGDPIGWAAPDPARFLPDGSAPIAVMDTGLMQGVGLDDHVVASLDAADPQQPISDPQGHGTQMGLIASGMVSPTGVQSEANTITPIIPIDIFDDNGFTSNYQLMQGLQFAIANGARVLSLSWGTTTESRFLKDTMDFAQANNLLVVAAAGNEPTGKPVFPAAYDTVIGVGALAPDGKPWQNSNFGDFVSLYAPGFASFPVGYKGDPGAYAGTSIATAYMAHVLGVYFSQNPSATPQEALGALTQAP